MKTNKLMTRLLSSALVALGFTACDNETTDDVYPLEYGSPSVDYRVKGKTSGSLSGMRGTTPLTLMPMIRFIPTKKELLPMK